MTQLSSKQVINHQTLVPKNKNTQKVILVLILEKPYRQLITGRITRQ